MWIWQLIIKEKKNKKFNFQWCICYKFSSKIYFVIIFERATCQNKSNSCKKMNKYETKFRCLDFYKSFVKWNFKINQIDLKLTNMDVNSLFY